MNRPEDPFGRSARNRASDHSNIFNNQGDGPMNINQGPGSMNIDNSTTNINAKYRTWTGWAVVVMLAADVIFFIYGASAYTGGRDTTGDGIRSIAYLVMLGVTINLIRRWFRQRL
ncbi:hypothetical protein ACFOWZ_25820 [Lentzea rhizosphaerae]|uniref:Uncharacterized protein n=1 Tax=Lentzea rhizosphaerae TaxID=2041025 RepID=A0ABV8BZ22_9PSEU